MNFCYANKVVAYRLPAQLEGEAGCTHLERIIS